MAVCVRIVEFPIADDPCGNCRGSAVPVGHSKVTPPEDTVVPHRLVSQIGRFEEGPDARLLVCLKDDLPMRCG